MTAQSLPGPGTSKRSLNTPRIVFLVVAAAAPMAAMVGNVPLALKLGNGPGLPAAFLLATLILLCFSVGYAAMSRRVVNTGAFYTYVARGLGRPPAVGAALLALVSYNALAVGLVGAFGYFGQLIGQQIGVSLPWQFWSGLAILIVGLLGYRSVDLSARVLAVLMSAEIGILVIFDIGVVLGKGAAALPVASFAPSAVLTGSLGIALMFAFASFIGFESAALYGEESVDPRRSIPLATYISVILIGVFYCLTSWITIGAIGVGQAQQTASAELGNLLFTLNTRYVAGWVSDIMAILLCTSLLASLLAIHNAASRYMFALGREHLLPSALGRFHPHRYSPYRASLAQTAINVVVVLAFAFSSFDPYQTLAASMVGLSTLGIIALQAFAAVAILVYFRGRPEQHWWKTQLAPLIGCLGLLIGVVLLVTHYAALTSTTSPVVNSLPVLLLVVIIGGVAYALWLRTNRPGVYAQLASSQLRHDRTRTASSARYHEKYCIVGAGPSGLIMARAMLKEGVPFDLFERHSDVGGIWDPENAGSPMYESAHFISSKYTSHFYGYPMPEYYPDYPNYRQLLDYIRAFARDYGLYPHMTFNTAVTQAEPNGDGWLVTLSTGEQRRYAGIICANGVTWHPSLPQYPGLERFAGEVRHSVTYRSSQEFRDRRVLIVGAGNSGVDIACDAARSARKAFISLRRGYRFIPKHIFGVPTDVFINEQVMPPKGVVVPDDPSTLIDAIVGDLTRFGLSKPDHKALASHPIMNTQIIHHLAHGDITARPDVKEFREHSVVFVDGCEEEIDLVLFATGYEYRIPYVSEQLFEWHSGHPHLYLNVFNRKVDNLYMLGFIEFADAAYQRFDEMAQLILIDIHARVTGEKRDRIQQLKRSDQPDLRGNMTYIDSPRHTNYVETHTYQHKLAEVRDEFGWPDPDDHFYDELLVPVAVQTRSDSTGIPVQVPVEEMSEAGENAVR